MKFNKNKLSPISGLVPEILKYDADGIQAIRIGFRQQITAAATQPIFSLNQIQMPFKNCKMVAGKSVLINQNAAATIFTNSIDHLIQSANTGADGTSFISPVSGGTTNPVMGGMLFNDSSYDTYQMKIVSAGGNGTAGGGSSPAEFKPYFPYLVPDQFSIQVRVLSTSYTFAIGDFFFFTWDFLVQGR